MLAKYRSIGDFSDGLARVTYIRESDGFIPYTYIDKTGKRAIDNDFGMFSTSFNDGFAYVVEEYPGNRTGLIDRRGRFIFSTVRPDYSSLAAGYSHPEFHEGLMPIRVNEKVGFVDKSGNLVIRPRFLYAKAFSEGLAAVNMEHGGKWGYINKRGEWVIRPQFDQATKFKEGRAVVVVGHLRYGNERFGIIDRSGNYVLELSKNYIIPGYSEGLIPYYDGNKCGYLDRNGNVAINPIFGACNDFENGYAEVFSPGDIKLINKNGEYVFDPKYFTARRGEYVFLVSDDYECFAHIDRGELFCGDKILNFSTDVIFLRRDDNIYVMDNEGNVINTIDHDIYPIEWVEYFSDGMAAFICNNRWGYINKKGEIVIEPKFEMEDRWAVMYPSASFKGGWAAIKTPR